MLTKSFRGGHGSCTSRLRRGDADHVRGGPGLDGAAELAAGHPAGRRPGPAGAGAAGLPSRPAVHRLHQVPVRGVCRERSARLPAGPEGLPPGRHAAHGGGRPAPARPGHGRGALPDPAPPRRAALAGRPGHRTRPAGRLPAPDRAVDHARHGVRGPDRRGPGRPALAAAAPAVDGAGRGARPGRLGDGPPGRRDLHPARAGLRADHRAGLARQADQGGGAVRRLRPAHPGDQLPELRGHQAFLARPVRGRDHLRPGRGRRRLRHADAAPLRARALPLPEPAGAGPGLAGPRGHVADQVRGPPAGDAPRGDGGQLQPACLRAAALAGGQRDRPGRHQALRRRSGSPSPATRPSRAGSSSGPSRCTRPTSPMRTAICGSPSSIRRAR